MLLDYRQLNCATGPSRATPACQTDQWTMSIIWQSALTSARWERSRPMFGAASKAPIRSNTNAPMNYCCRPTRVMVLAEIGHSKIQSRPLRSATQNADERWMPGG